MVKKITISYKPYYNDEVLQCFVKDPTKSIKEIAEKLNSYRQKIWRRKKKMEEENIIWGYTTIINESKLHNVMYLILMKMKPMSKELCDMLIQRNVKRIPEKQQVRLLNVLYINGAFDLIIMFIAPNHATARRYYDSLRISYEPFLLEKPVIVDVNFRLIREGKVNPEIESLYDFVPL